MTSIDDLNVAERLAVKASLIERLQRITQDTFTPLQVRAHAEGDNHFGRNTANALVKLFPKDYPARQVCVNDRVVSNNGNLRGRVVAVHGDRCSIIDEANDRLVTTWIKWLTICDE